MKKSLTWNDIYKLGKTDNANRWFPHSDYASYFANIRTPSRSWPHSYARAALTNKFARWLINNHPAQAAKLGLIESTIA